MAAYRSYFSSINGHLITAEIIAYHEKAGGALGDDAIKITKHFSSLKGECAAAPIIINCRNEEKQKKYGR